jgi:hypothetical protein
MNKQALSAHIGSRMNVLGFSADFTGAVFVDGTGVGWGVRDRLNQLGCPNLVGMDFGAWADRTDSIQRPRKALTAPA